VIVDEAYLEYLEDFPARTAVNLTRTGANVAVFRTFAKVWGLAGLPLGYLVAPRALADSLRQSGLGSPRDLNRLAVVAASASLRDADHVRQVRIATTRAREKWHAFLDARKIRHTDSQANFVYFDAGRPHAEVARFFAAEGIVIGRAFPPHDTWVRISLGTPEENMRAQVVCARLLR
jgi:histidinol-phosphate aminotransferase